MAFAFAIIAIIALVLVGRQAFVIAGISISSSFIRSTKRYFWSRSRKHGKRLMSVSSSQCVSPVDGML
jgi:hypothetical protein